MKIQQQQQQQQKKKNHQNHNHNNNSRSRPPSLSPKNYVGITSNGSPTSRQGSSSSSSTATTTPTYSLLLSFGCGILVGFFLSSMVFFGLVASSSSSSSSSSSTNIPTDESGIGGGTGKHLEGFRGKIPFDKRRRRSERRGRLGGHGRVDSSSPSTSHTSEEGDGHDDDGDGWKTIQVFYGNTSHLVDSSEIPSDYFASNRWFSQARQDEIVSKLLNEKRDGYFIDLAANDAVRLSNSYALETHYNWTGLCIEPNPIYWAGLSYRKCDVVGAVVGLERMDEVQFRFPRSKGPKGGIIGSNFDNKDDKWKEAHRRYTVPLEEIFERHHVPKVIDYFNLDVEGAEEFVLTSFPFDRYRFNVLTIERPTDAVASMLTENGYRLLKTIKSHEDTLWIHHSIVEDITIKTDAALAINSEQYKYRDNTGKERIVPEELEQQQQQQSKPMVQ